MSTPSITCLSKQLPSTCWIAATSIFDAWPSSRAAAFFVTRIKKNLDCERRCSRRVDKSTGLHCDQTIVLKGIKSARDYPNSLRRVSYVDVVTKKRLVFLTNNFNLPAIVIPQLYKCR
ncbi:MAG: hypothetical protein K8T89_22880 [Planctomycetes bacterium]|nr:hypothetical protein [Planctomycetota bacterium]